MESNRLGSLGHDATHGTRRRMRARLANPTTLDNLAFQSRRGRDNKTKEPLFAGVNLNQPVLLRAPLGFASTLRTSASS